MRIRIQGAKYQPKNFYSKNPHLIEKRDIPKILKFCYVKKKSVYLKDPDLDFIPVRIQDPDMDPDPHQN